MNKILIGKIIGLVAGVGSIIGLSVTALILDKKCRKTKCELIKTKADLAVTELMFKAMQNNVCALRDKLEEKNRKGSK